jgi:hypothetical protein
MVAILIVGRSGSGKTRIATDYAKTLDVPTYIVNDKTGQKELKKVAWDSLDSLEDACIVVDDLISCTTAEFTKLQNLLNFAGHHRRLEHIIVIVHSVLRNNVFGLLGLLTHVWFTLSKSNVRSVSAVLDYYRFDKADRAKALAEFLATRDEFGFYELDVEKHEFRRHADRRVQPAPGGDKTLQMDSAAASAASRMDECRRTASRLLPLLQEPSKAAALFDMIISRIPLSNVSPSDLTIALRTKTSGAPVTVSLVDYVHHLTRDTKPSAEIKGLHRYVTKYVVLHKCLIENSSLD